MSGKVIRVRFIDSQSGNCEDIFRGIDDKKFYSRLERGEWGYSTKWSGGYERAYSLSPGNKIEVFNKKNELLFEEDSHGVSADNYPFTWDIGKELRAGIVKEFNLIGYDDWKMPLLNKQQELGNKDYRDNWLYCYLNLIESDVLNSVNYYDDTFEVVKQVYEHNLCDLKWVEYSMISKNTDDCQIVFGYRYI